MNLSRNVSEIIRKHVTLEVESIDRMYLKCLSTTTTTGPWGGWILSPSSRFLLGLANEDLGLDPSTITQGRMTYQLRRLRLHGFIERLPRKHRYRVTPFGLRIALLYTRTYVSVLRPGLSQIVSDQPPGDARLRSHFDKATEAVEQWCRDAKLAA